MTPPPPVRMVVRFWPGMPDGLKQRKQQDEAGLLGLKGAGLLHLCSLGLPTPEGFILTTQATQLLLHENEQLLAGLASQRRPLSDCVAQMVFPDQLFGELKEAMAWLESRTGSRFGDASSPLLVSIRSGATVSMPGLLETVCNVGLTEETVRSLGQESPQYAFLLDCFRRFLEGWGSARCGIAKQRFRALLESLPSPGQIGSLISEYLKLCPLASDPWQVLKECILSVLLSGLRPNVTEFLRTNYIREPVGQAVIVQRMVFGNLDSKSCSGVVFTRDPSTGDRPENQQGSCLFGQIMMTSQGADVVQDMGEISSIRRLGEVLPDVYEQLGQVCRRLECKTGSVQDIEFTVQSGQLYILQARPAKMAPRAFLRAQLDMVDEGLISKPDALARTDPRQLERALHSTTAGAPTGPVRLIARGRPLVPGFACGRACFDTRKVREFRSRNEPAIFCCQRLLLAHVPIMDVVDGIISSQRNVLSHATLNARFAGRPSIVRASVKIDRHAALLKYGGEGIRPGAVKEGDFLCIDAHRGEIYEGQMEINVLGPADPIAERFCNLLAETGSIRAYAQAEDYETYAIAKQLGADGVANFRSDTLFFRKSINFALCDYVLSVGTAHEEIAKQHLLDRLTKEFLRIFHAIDENYIAIRLCKHTIYEYFPKDPFEVKALARYINTSHRQESAGQPNPNHQDLTRTIRMIRKRKRQLEDYNPIMGRRGVRLATTFPQIYETQIKAILLAMLQSRQQGKEMRVDLLIPFVSVAGELRYVRRLVQRTAETCGGNDLLWDVAPVIEMTGPAFEMEDIASHCNLVVIRSDKLTTSTHHLVREDSGEFLGRYVARGWFFGDPFRVIQRSTERIVQHAVEAAKQANPGIRIMVSGNHCANEYSLRRLLKLGITEVCCPPTMVPVAKLIAAKIKSPASHYAL